MHLACDPGRLVWRLAPSIGAPKRPTKPLSFDSKRKQLGGRVTRKSVGNMS